MKQPMNLEDGAAVDHAGLLSGKDNT